MKGTVSVKCEDVKNIIPGYFYKGKDPQILVVTSYNMQFYGINSNESIFIGAIDDLMENTQPFVLDINGDYYNDIVYNNKNNQRVVASYDINQDDYTIHPFNEFVNPQFNNDESLTACQRPLAIPHSSGFLDLNKDMLSDIFIISEQGGIKYIEIWTRTNLSPALYTLSYNQELPYKTSQIAFADMSILMTKIKLEATI